MLEPTDLVGLGCCKVNGTYNMQQVCVGMHWGGGVKEREIGPFQASNLWTLLYCKWTQCREWRVWGQRQLWAAGGLVGG